MISTLIVGFTQLNSMAIDFATKAGINAVAKSNS
jgi:hypothetical protein